MEGEVNVVKQDAIQASRYSKGFKREQRMHKRTVILLVVGMQLLAGRSARAGQTSASDDQDKIVITFKDGHQQSFRVVDVARIEFSQSARRISTASSVRFVGRWKVGDGAGGTFYITLKPEGKAEKTLGSRDGTWTLVNGEARVSWQDGWHDAIRKLGNKYQKVAFSPGSSFDDEPSNVAQAEYTEPH